MSEPEMRLDGPAPLSPETRQQMGRLMLGASISGPASYSLPNGPQKRPLHAPQSPALMPTFLPSVIALTAQIRHELENNLPKLLSLNPSRREAVAQHLDRLAGLPPAPSATAGMGDAAGGLRRWIEGPRTPAQTQALLVFFDEVALISLGQALLLKAWSDRGLRQLREEDLGRLNWALGSALKPHVPLDREGWQITRPNLYSWYNPSASIQRDIWSALEGWRVTDEGPSMLASLLRGADRGYVEAGLRPASQYDVRFFQTLWERLGDFGFDAAPEATAMRRRKTAFSPTLRDGTIVRTGPSTLTWVGLEAQPFPLLVAELVQLWWGPAAPPVWAQGSGLEVHSRDQLQLALGSPKPSLYTRIGEMEACDLGFVLEERCVRVGGRAPESLRLREQLDQLPYFKRLRANGASQGDLQACVALTKLRPGGLLWWLREEPLSANDGLETLGFLLERGKLLCEWDFSELDHALPAAQPLFPKHLYLLQREAGLEARLSHRPSRVTLHGQIRSHVEVPLVLSDALQAFSRGSVPTRGHWQVHLQQSPTTQKDWAERWPDPTAHDSLRALEKLRTESTPLASVCTVRATPSGDPSRDHVWSIPAALKGLWIRADEGPNGRRLRAEPLPRPGSEAKGTGLLVLFADETWIAPLTAYLESGAVHSWLEHHAERRGDRWVLSEQVAKFIPVSKDFLAALGGAPSTAASEGFASPLPGEWEKLAADVVYDPRGVIDRLSSLPMDANGGRIRAALFVRAARALEQLKNSQQRLLSLVSQDGTLCWKSLLGILPKTECIPITLHPQIRLSGSMPPHLPLGRIERVKAPAPGILLATESGFHLHVAAENPRLIDMLASQLDGLAHPTWNELTQFLKLPRRVDLAETTAHDVLRSHGEQMARLGALTDLLSACSVF